MQQRGKRSQTMLSVDDLKIGVKELWREAGDIYALEF
jgi:hypothetical protein